MEGLYYIKLYGIIFVLLLSLYYFIPVGLMYLVFYTGKKPFGEKRRIDHRVAARKQISREIRYSVLTMAILGALFIPLYEGVRMGYSKMYYSVSDYGWLYFFCSILLAFVFHDAYFYFAHRLMHLPKIFPIVHRIHHLSVHPTPWAIYSFHPMETLIMYPVYPLLLFLFPYHPVAYGIYLFLYLVHNIAGHMNVEISPPLYAQSPVLRYMNRVAHHNLHHRKLHCNYALFFNVWDRMMHTFRDENKAEIIPHKNVSK